MTQASVVSLFLNTMPLANEPVFAPSTEKINYLLLSDFGKSKEILQVEQLITVSKVQGKYFQNGFDAKPFVTCRYIFSLGSNTQDIDTIHPSATWVGGNQ